MFDLAATSPRREVRLHGSTITLPSERKFASIASIQLYLDRVLELDWVRDQWLPRPITVRERAGQKAAHYEPDTATVAVPPQSGSTSWAMRELVVLHELAHHLGNEQPPHGPAFLGRLLRLVDELIGPEGAFVLRTTLYDCGAQVS